MPTRAAPAQRMACVRSARYCAVQAFFIEYETGVRVIVHTANLIRIDFDNKTQGMWWQDFPRKVCMPLSPLLCAYRHTPLVHPALQTGRA